MNRASAAFDEAERFIFDAEHAPLLSRGGGSHACVDASLVQLEVQVALLGLYQRFSGFADPQARRRTDVAAASLLACDRETERRGMGRHLMPKIDDMSALERKACPCHPFSLFPS